jgi:hypothetical protein
LQLGFCAFVTARTVFDVVVDDEIGLMPKSWDGEYYWFWIGTHEEYNRFRF